LKKNGPAKKKRLQDSPQKKTALQKKKQDPQKKRAEKKEKKRGNCLRKKETTGTVPTADIYYVASECFPSSEAHHHHHLGKRMAGCDEGDEEDIDALLRIEEEIEGEAECTGRESGDEEDDEVVVNSRRRRLLGSKRKRAVEESSSSSEEEEEEAPEKKKKKKTTRGGKGGARKRYVDDAASASSDSGDDDDDEDDDDDDEDSHASFIDDGEDEDDATLAVGPVRPRGVFSDESDAESSSSSETEAKRGDAPPATVVGGGEKMGVGGDAPPATVVGGGEKMGGDESEAEEEGESEAAEEDEGGVGGGDDDDDDDEDEDEMDFPEIEDVPDSVYNDTRNSNNMSRSLKVVDSGKIMHMSDQVPPLRAIFWATWPNNTYFGQDGYTYCFLSEAEGPMLSSMAKKQILMLLHVINAPVHRKHVVETKELKPHFCQSDKTLEKLILSVFPGAGADLEDNIRHNIDAPVNDIPFEAVCDYKASSDVSAIRAATGDDDEEDGGFAAAAAASSKLECPVDVGEILVSPVTASFTTTAAGPEGAVASRRTYWLVMLKTRICYDFAGHVHSLVTWDEVRTACRDDWPCSVQQLTRFVCTGYRLQDAPDPPGWRRRRGVGGVGGDDGVPELAQRPHPGGPPVQLQGLPERQRVPPGAGKSTQ
jgi:hypothetical protein